MAPVSLLDAYLATTPGGLTVVAATAYGAGANTALITAIQMLRLIVMLATAPALVRLTVSALDAAVPPASASSRTDQTAYGSAVVGGVRRPPRACARDSVTATLTTPEGR
jgi:hypothetical protein